ncbi:uncharacterized protein [Coffea arabica]|uniref:Uncharacterized protein isoform X3 n=1 Tax=Coffea arabica TaxID=13443 RepID=A0ABM4VTU1_COFAR
MDGPPENDFCSICHGNFHLPSQANCSHWFCTNCILQVWNHGPALQPCKCPLCRRQITLLIPSEASSRLRHNAEVSEILQKVETYNRLFSERSNDLVQAVLSTIYVLSPVDIIPEVPLVQSANPSSWHLLWLTSIEDYLDSAHPQTTVDSAHPQRFILRR